MCVCVCVSVCVCVCNTSTFSAMRFDEDPFTCKYETESKKASRFQISYFYWSFSSDIITVKGLIGLPLFSMQTHVLYITWRTREIHARCVLKMTCFAIIKYESNNVGSHNMFQKNPRELY